MTKPPVSKKFSGIKRPRAEGEIVDFSWAHGEVVVRRGTARHQLKVVPGTWGDDTATPTMGFVKGGPVVMFDMRPNSPGFSHQTQSLPNSRALGLVQRGKPTTAYIFVGRPPARAVPEEQAREARRHYDKNFDHS